MVEMVGVEPTSENTSPLLSTSVSAELISPRKALSSAASFGQFLNCQWAGTTPNDRSLLSWTSALSQQVNPRGRAAAIELRWLSYIKLLKQLTPYDNQLFDYLLRLNLNACFLKWPAHLLAYSLSVSPSKPLHPLSNHLAHLPSDLAANTPICIAFSDTVALIVLLLALSQSKFDFYFTIFKIKRQGDKRITFTPFQTV